MVHILEVVSSRRNDLQMVSALARIVLNLPNYSPFLFPLARVVRSKMCIHVKHSSRRSLHLDIFQRRIDRSADRETGLGSWMSDFFPRAPQWSCASRSNTLVMHASRFKSRSRFRRTIRVRGNVRWDRKSQGGRNDDVGRCRLDGQPCKCIWYPATLRPAADFLAFVLLPVDVSHSPFTSSSRKRSSLACVYAWLFLAVWCMRVVDSDVTQPIHMSRSFYMRNVYNNTLVMLVFLLLSPSSCA